MRKLLCEIFKSPRREEMYLYVEKARGLVDVPEVLLERFGKPVSAMTLILDESRPLARADAAEVIAAIDAKGFYLQMPSAREEYLLDLYKMPTEARY